MVKGCKQIDGFAALNRWAEHNPNRSPFNWLQHIVQSWMEDIVQSWMELIEGVDAGGQGPTGARGPSRGQGPSGACGPSGDESGSFSTEQ